MIGKKINQLATELAPESTDLTIIGDPTTGVSKKITLAQLGAIFSGAVSFYTNLASFPATGDINVIYCAKDTQKLYLWTGSAYVEVFPSQALLDTYQLRSEKGNANGYASLDSQGKVPISQLPSSIMEYKGTWNASTNTPTLANGTGDTGDVYICNVAGTVNFGAGPITFAVGDYVIYSGTIWQRSSGAVGTVTSVAASITGDSVTISGSPVTTSGTLAFAFAGTGAQYIKGDGTLATFPTTIDQAKNLITEVYNSTGATLTKGTVVYINGGQGNLPTVTKALASGDSTSAQTYGIVQADITNNNNGFVVVAGRLADIDTSAFSVGTQLYLSSTTAGAYTSTKQYAPAHLVYVGIIVRSHPTQGIIEVKIQNGYELDELHNVAAQTPTNNDGLFWESATSLWKNKSIATVLGYTPANAATYVPYTGATANVDLGAFDLISRSAYLEGTASYQAGLLIKQRGLYNFVTGAYTQIVADSATDLNIVHNQANTTRRRYALSVAALQDGDTFQYLLPRANGTIALTSQLTGGTVTSVAALTIGTSGTDLSSTVANGTTTPVITLNVPTASATNRGALSSTDWTTFNNKQNALTNPVTGTGTTNYLPKFTGTSTIGNSQIIDSTNILINRTSSFAAGTYTGQKLQVTGGIGINSDSADGVARLTLLGNSSTGDGTIDWGGNGNFNLVFSNNGNTRMTINGSGNLGLGVTPSAWSSTLAKAIQVGNLGSSIWSYTTSNTSTPYTFIDNNAYYDGTNNIYIVNNRGAARYQQVNNEHRWEIAPSGTAGNAISFTQAMTLNASGNLGIGSTNPGAKLDVNGSAIIGSDSVNGNVIIQSNETPLIIRGRTTYSAAGLALTWDISPNTGLIVAPTLGFNTNATLGSSVGTRALTLASTGAATFSSSVQATSLGMNVAPLSDRVLYISGNLSTTGASQFQSVMNGTVVNAATNIYGMYVGNNSNVNLTNSYAIYIETTGGSGSISNKYGIYQASSGDKNYFAGNVGIGTTSPGSYALAVEYGGSAAAVISIKNSSASGYSGAHLLNNSGSLMGHFGYANASTAGLTDKVYFGSIASKDVVFTTNDTERMRITSGGDLLVNSTTVANSAKLTVQTPTGNVISAWQSSTSGNAGFISFGTEGTFTERGYIYYDRAAGQVKLSATSDARLKTNIVNAPSVLSLINKINVKQYDWKETGSSNIGFIAQELYDIIPRAVSVGEDNKDGSIKRYWGVDNGTLVPYLVKAIQELKQELDTLKNK